MKPITLFAFVLFFTFSSEAKQYRLKSITTSARRYFQYNPASRTLLFYANKKSKRVPDVHQLSNLLSGWGSFYISPENPADDIDSIAEYQTWKGKEHLHSFTIQKFDTAGRVVIRVSAYRDEKNHQPFGPYEPCYLVNKQGYHCGGHDSIVYDTKGRIVLLLDVNDHHYTKRAYKESGGYTDTSYYYGREAHVPTVTYFLFDSLGRQQERFNPNDTVYSIKCFYESPNDRTKITHVVYRYNNDTNHIITTHDDKGRQTESIIYRGMTGTTDGNRKIKFIYNDNEATVVQLEYMSSSDTAWHYTTRSIYYYNEAGLPVKAVRYIWNDKRKRWRNGLRFGRQKLLLQYEEI